jgi:hypothetical protein
MVGEDAPASRIEYEIEESLTLKRKLTLSILALVPALLLPLALNGQIAKERKPAAEGDQFLPKYEVSVGYGYTSLNQLNQSRNGLQGVNITLARDWGKYFGVVADGGYYKYPYDTTNPGDPSVSMVLVGPKVHAQIAGPVSGFIDALFGGVHTGGESMTPNISFASGIGGGLEYRLNKRAALRLAGDNIESAFVQDPNHLGYSTHERWNPRMSLGVVYKF